MAGSVEVMAIIKFDVSETNNFIYLEVDISIDTNRIST